jgi:peptidoglycan/xylan/chitin deacetylase (PgdA/CDA1 family)
MMFDANRLRVLTYHRIAELESGYEGDPQLISATPSGFERQMAHLAGNYQVISAKQVIESLESRTPLVRRAVLIGFDDAYRDFKTNAWPVLQKFELPAIVFVSTAYPDAPNKLFWWDRLHRSIMNSTSQALNFPPLGLLPLSSAPKRLESLRSLQDYIKSQNHSNALAMVDEICSRLGEKEVADNGVLGWDELRQLSVEGVELCSHTQTHPILTNLSADQIRAEVAGSYRDLKREIGDVLPIISYPNGNCDSGILKILQQEGFKLGFTAQDGHNDLAKTNPLLLRRTNITLKTSPLLFRLRLMWLFGYLDQWRHGTFRPLSG